MFLGGKEPQGPHTNYKLLVRLTPPARRLLCSTPLFLGANLRFFCVFFFIFIFFVLFCFCYLVVLFFGCLFCVAPGRPVRRLVLVLRLPGPWRRSWLAFGSLVLAGAGPLGMPLAARVGLSGFRLIFVFFLQVFYRMRWGINLRMRQQWCP